MKEVGALRELDVKPGDVVEYLYNKKVWVKGVIDASCVAQMENGLEQYKKYSTDPHWRIISRAADTPKLWRDMTDAEKGALLLAYHEGKVVENKGKWNDWIAATPCWDADYAYRIRPEPKVEVVTMYAASNMKGFGPTRGVKSAYQITFNTIDGKPDCASIKMEAI